MEICAQNEGNVISEDPRETFQTAQWHTAVSESSAVANLVFTFGHGHNNSRFDAIHNVNVSLADQDLSASKSVANFITASFAELIRATDL